MVKLSQGGILMDFDPNQFAGMFKIDKIKIASQICAFIGCILLFVSLWIPYPIFIVTLVIGGGLVIFYFAYKMWTKRKTNKSNNFVKIKKRKIQQCRRLENDNAHIIAICSSCNQKIRLPYKKGQHSVTCPICKEEFKVKVK